MRLKFVSSTATACALLFVLGCATVPDAGRTANETGRDTAVSGGVLEYAWQPDPQFRVVPLAQTGNDEYKKQGVTYKVVAPGSTYSEKGTAIYRPDSQRRSSQTTTGIRWHDDGLVAAHRFVPVPSFVRVFNPNNQHSANVLVVDRGPFHENAVIELSRAAAQKLDFGSATAVHVEIELLHDVPIYRVETDMVYGRSRAEGLRASIERLGWFRGVIVPHSYENRFRVMVSPFNSHGDAFWFQRWLINQHNLRSTLVRN